jgi:hypothetical protein
VLSNGNVALGRWYRESAEEPIRLLGAENQPIALTPGNAWIELLEAFPNDDIANPGSTVVIR